MKVIARGRRTGKTGQLIRESAESGAMIVCMTRKECSRIFHIARELGLYMPFPISFSEFLNRQYHAPGIRGFLIDNADQLLLHLTDVPILTVSISTPVIPEGVIPDTK